MMDFHETKWKLFIIYVVMGMYFHETKWKLFIIYVVM